MSGMERLYLEALFVAYSAVWVVLFAFLHRMDRKASRLERDVSLLKSSRINVAEEPVDPPIGGPSV